MSLRSLSWSHLIVRNNIIFACFLQEIPIRSILLFHTSAKIFYWSFWSIVIWITSSWFVLSLVIESFINLCRFFQDLSQDWVSDTTRDRVLTASSRLTSWLTLLRGYYSILEPLLLSSKRAFTTFSCSFSGFKVHKAALIWISIWTCDNSRKLLLIAWFITQICVPSIIWNPSLL